MFSNNRGEECKKCVEELDQDAYIMGEHIGDLLEVGYHMHGNDIRGTLVRVLEEKDKKGESPLS